MMNGAPAPLHPAGSERRCIRALLEQATGGSHGRISLMRIAQSSVGACGKQSSRIADLARVTACFFMAALLAVAPVTSAGPASGFHASAGAKPSTDPVLKVMQSELARATT